MRIKDDLNSPAYIRTSRMDWVPSPASGVDRRMLFRVGNEVARATSIVRYQPGCAFPPHHHSGGEEFVVLEGVFQDEHGDYEAGTYVRNPPGTTHAPSSANGCTIFVRLWQFRDGDSRQIVRRPGEGTLARSGDDARESRIVFDDGFEDVRYERWQGASAITIANPLGLEFLVMSGSVSINDDGFDEQSWGRLPAGCDLRARVGDDGATVWMKSGPLVHPTVLQLP